MVVAAGSGARLGAPKAFAPFRGQPLLLATCAALDLGLWESATVVVRAEDIPRAQGALAGAAANIISGGATRSESVRLGVAQGRAAIVVVHDAARPLVSPQGVQDLLTAVRAGSPGATLARPCPHALAEVADGLIAQPSPPGLWEVHTPQAFARAALEPLLGPEVPEESRLLTQAGLKVAAIHDPTPNPKITYPGDLEALA